jgi:SAM-dependent methyltransferase
MSSSPNPHRDALEQYRRRASIYDIELALFEPIRRSAIAKLDLKPGDTVIDAGCGTGLSLPQLQAAIGSRGRIVGFDQCPEMLAKACESVQQHRWRNVTLIQASAEDAAIASTTPSRADAALFHFTHDILRAPAAIDNVVQALRPGASVVACGLKWAAPWAWPVNLFVFGAALHSVSSLDGLAQPWSLLAARLDAFEVESILGGAVYLARGTLRAPAR